MKAFSATFSLAFLLSFAPAIAGQPGDFPKPNYCFAFLNAVPNRPNLPEKEAMEIQKRHLGHLESLWQKGWLQAAGPILSPGGPRGVLISKCKSVQEANELASEDPAVQNKRLFVESYQWTGPEGIGEAYRKAKAANPDAKEQMIKYSLVMVSKSAEWRDGPPKDVFEAHGTHLGELLKTGKVAAAGPLHNDSKWLAVIILRDTPLADARSMIERDPIVKGGFAAVEAYEWLASDGLFPQP